MLNAIGDCEVTRLLGGRAQMEKASALQAVMSVFAESSPVGPPSPPQEGEGLAIDRVRQRVENLSALAQHVAATGPPRPEEITRAETRASAFAQVLGIIETEAAAAPASPVAGDVPADSVIPSAALKLSATKSQIDAASPVAEPRQGLAKLHEMALVQARGLDRMLAPLSDDDPAAIRLKGERHALLWTISRCESLSEPAAEPREGETEALETFLRKAREALWVHADADGKDDIDADALVALTSYYEAKGRTAATASLNTEGNADAR